MKEAHRRLRDATPDAHEAVDAVFGGYDLTDRAGYARFLSAHADVLIPVEAMLDAAGAAAVTPDWPERKRGDLLRADLADLAPENAAYPECVEGSWDTAPFDKLKVSEGGEAQAVATLAGMLYVVEGSRLGGRFLARRLPADFPRRYLDAHQAPGNWANLLASIDAILYDEARMNTAIAAALAVFGQFERSGRKWLPKE